MSLETEVENGFQEVVFGECQVTLQAQVFLGFWVGCVVRKGKEGNLDLVEYEDMKGIRKGGLEEQNISAF